MPSPSTSAMTRALSAKVRPMLDAAVGVAAQVHGVIDVDAHLPPHLRTGRTDVVVHTARPELIAIPVEAGDVVSVHRREDLLEAVGVHVSHGQVLVVRPPAAPRFAKAGPAGQPGRTAHGSEGVLWGR